MNKVELLEAIKQGTTDIVGKDFRFEGLEELNLTEITFVGCNFYQANFNRSKLEACNFIRCHLADTYWYGSVLDCRFEECNLDNANFMDTNIVECSFPQCSLISAHFNDAKFATTCHAIIGQVLREQAITFKQSTLAISVQHNGSYCWDSFIKEFLEIGFYDELRDALRKLSQYDCLKERVRLAEKYLDRKHKKMLYEIGEIVPTPVKEVVPVTVDNDFDPFLDENDLP